MPGRWWRPGRDDRVEPCNATELLLRSGRIATSTGGAPYDGDGPVEDGLASLGHRLEVAMISLGPYRDSEDTRLSLAYRCVHNGMGDLAAILLSVTGVAPRAGPARPGRRRRPWGARS